MAACIANACERAEGEGCELEPEWFEAEEEEEVRVKAVSGRKGLGTCRWKKDEPDDAERAARGGGSGKGAFTQGLPACVDEEDIDMPCSGLPGLEGGRLPGREDGRLLGWEGGLLPGGEVCSSASEPMSSESIQFRWSCSSST